MKKRIWQAVIIITVILITVLTISCSGSSDSSGSEQNAAIEEVKDSLTTGIVGDYEAVKYEEGYVVNFEDMAYWYVEDGVVWSLNGFAKTYAEHTEYKYGIKWEDLF